MTTTPGTITRRRQGLADRTKLHRIERALPRSYWRPEDGPCLWWSFPVQEIPFIGTPHDDAFPDYCTHWTPLIVPVGGA